MLRLRRLTISTGSVFASRYDGATKAKAKNDFRDKLIDAFDDLGLPELNEKQKFGVDSKKVVLEAVCPFTRTL